VKPKRSNPLAKLSTRFAGLRQLELEVEFPSSQETEIIVSTKAVTEIQRLLREEGEVKLSIGESQIAFELNEPCSFRS
jgi:DNA polymerase-3 subunit beta